MTGIRYITDDKGKKTDLVINIEEHQEMVEDLLDALTIEERRGEESMPFEDFVAQFKAERGVNE
ncbi:hypothetical protein [Dyadobacter sandarakinus]|uniref:Uncharacterized protein n=1 Tax=Dyadobacter sandarakinus TaxID=2747268 RepID=A0ABX7IB31_9BACT|nr:hypothetical protein [Dyadobacter sandarakinus]QRR02652.1 hypothetical protein HWI92_17900 [Dyadobacter sandarakinus]